VNELAKNKEYWDEKN